MARACAVGASRLLLDATPVHDEFIQQCTKDDVAPECLPEAASDMIVPPSAAALAGSEGSVLGMLMVSPAQPVTLGLPGGNVMTTRAALSRARLPPQHGEGVLMAFPDNPAELGVASALRDGQGSVDAALRKDATEKQGNMLYRYIEPCEATKGTAGTHEAKAYAVTKESWAWKISVPRWGDWKIQRTFHQLGSNLLQLCAQGQGWRVLAGVTGVSS